MSPTSALVPPMSIVSARANPAARSTAAAPTTPPAGPDSASWAALDDASCAVRIPPLDVITPERRQRHGPQPLREPAHVTGDARAQVRLGHRGGCALVLADLRKYLGRADHVDVEASARARAAGQSHARAPDRDTRAAAKRRRRRAPAPAPAPRPRQSRAREAGGSRPPARCVRPPAPRARPARAAPGDGASDRTARRAPAGATPADP